MDRQTAAITFLYRRLFIFQCFVFFFSSRRRHTRCSRDWSSDVCSSDLEAHAGDFRLFCDRNPGPCPLLDLTAPGDPVPRAAAPDADLRTDVPLYRVHRDGELVEERPDLLGLWRGDLVAFLLGCSFTFEEALREAGLPLRHLERGSNVSMYVTNRMCAPAGRFVGPMVVSMRPFPRAELTRVAE